ncbi:hypothetical protein JTB14_007463 [Gonioctena quinquepunctata]|nr:hypothetical protein JTB14_007463 [Gonioctena quinquepunctata]
MKHKDNFKFIKDHKIICCAKPKELEEEISILKQTIGELTEEIQAEPLRVESELNELVESQSNTIIEAKARIRKLEDYIDCIENKPVETTAVQTISSGNESKSSRNTPVEEKHVSVSTQIKQERNTESSQSYKTTKNPFPTRNKIQKTSKEIKENINASNHNPKIMIVAGTHGRNLSRMLTSKIKIL